MNKLAVSQQDLSKRTLLFCGFTIFLVCGLALVLMAIDHSPVGLFGAAGIVLVLTVQQYLQRRRVEASLSVVMSQAEVVKNAG